MFSWKSFEKPIVGLSPMAGFTDSPFRQICREYGADILYSELISATALFYNKENKETLHLCSFAESERPFILQLFGRDPDHFLKAIEAIEKAGIKPDGIDINMGCPARKVVKTGYGSALMRESGQSALIIRALKKETKYSISVKTRSGWDSSTAPDFAMELEQAGLDAICIHARTYKQGFTGKADWSVIEEVKKSVKIPVIGNGDIKKAADVYSMLDQTGCDGVLIGRASLGNPWIFRDFKDNTETIKSYEVVAEVLMRHLSLSVEFYGEEKGMREMRKHYASYLRGIIGGKELVRNLIGAVDKEEAFRYIESFRPESSILEPKR